MKAAVIGGGVMGREHLKALAQIPQVDVAAVVGPDTAAAERVLGVAEIEGAQVFDNSEEMSRHLLSADTDAQNHLSILTEI